MNSSNSSITTEQNILDPRPSIARTSISITSTGNDSQAISKHISRLMVASSYLKPVIDEIISKATSFTRLEFQELLERKSPICSITSEQYTRACKASEILGENPHFHEYIVNTVTQINDDRIYIDRDLLKQLIDLQTMILETIKKLRDKFSEDMDVDDLRNELEQNFVIVDKELKQRQIEDEYFLKTPGVQTLTVKNCSNGILKEQDMEKASEMTAEIPTTSDLYVNIHSKKNVDDGVQPDDNSELILKTDINDPDNTLNVPQTIKEETELDLENSGGGEREYRIEMLKLLKFENDMEEMKRAVRNLTNEVEILKGGGRKVEQSNFAKNVPQEDLEWEILDCLKELRQIKNALGRMNNPELTLDRPSRDENEPCCKLCDFPHIHAKLNGIPVIIKLNKSSIDILLAEEEERKQGRVEYPTSEKGGVRCMCGTTKEREEILVTKVESYVHTKYKSSPFDLSETSEKRQRTVVQSAFTHQISSDLDYSESIESLPYTVTKRSLPSINICPSMNINIEQLKRNMRSSAIEHPKDCIQKHLAAVGVDNLIKASIPAECCRKAVINEAEREDEPFHASINSLPLTTSDLKIITDPNKYAQNHLHQYTNFRENIANNIDYYLPKSNVYEVRFFRVFRSKSKASLAERLSEILKKIIFNDGETGAKEAPPPAKVMKNKKCQTKEKVEKSQHKPVKNSGSKEKIKSSSVQSRDGDACEEEAKPKEKSKHKSQNKSLEKSARQQYYNANQSVFACNTNLGTIYESEERHHRRKSQKSPLKTTPSLSDFINSPGVTESYQKFLATEAALGWSMYFEAKKSHKGTSSRDNFREESTVSLQRKRYGKYRKSSVSRIPRRIVKHTFSSTSSDGSTVQRVKRLKTQERIEKNELVIKVNPKNAPSEKKPEEQPKSHTSIISIPRTSPPAKLEAIASKNSQEQDVHKVSEANLKKSETPTTDCNPENSLESLQLLASKNGPGYITVLHPVCGCPEVSIFIPCYCREDSQTVLPREVVQKLVYRNDGRHIILPKGCRVEKCDGSCNDKDSVVLSKD